MDRKRTNERVFPSFFRPLSSRLLSVRYPLAIRFLSFSYPFAFHPFPILSRFPALAALKNSQIFTVLFYKRELKSAADFDLDHHEGLAFSILIKTQCPGLTKDTATNCRFTWTLLHVVLSSELHT